MHKVQTDKNRNSMRKILAICMALAGVVLASCCTVGNDDSGSEAVIETIMTRTSIRAFTDEPVSDEAIETLLRAGMAAPSAVNRQPWAFVVVRGRENLDRLGEVHPNARMLSTAQAAIVVCGDMTKALEGTAQAFWVQDASAATENILLAAHALGLGAVWTGVYPSQERVAAVSETLGLPSYVIPLCVIPIGCPAENPAPKDKWKPGNIHYDRW